MRISFAILLVIVFAGTAVFSVLAMGHNSNHIEGGCVASIARGVNCPKIEESALASLNFHLEIFSNFSTAIFVGIFGSLMLLLVALFLVSNSIIFAKIPLKINNFIHYCKEFLESYFSIFQREILQWLAFHKNSPNLVALRR